MDDSTDFLAAASAWVGRQQAMELAGTTTDAKAIHARADEAASTLPDEFKPSELLGVDAKGHLKQVTIAAHVVGGKFLPLKLPSID